MVTVGSQVSTSDASAPRIFVQPFEQSNVNLVQPNTSSPGAESFNTLNPPPANYINSPYSGAGTSIIQSPSNTATLTPTNFTGGGQVDPRVAQAAQQAFSEAGGGTKGVSDGKCCDVAKKTAVNLGAQAVGSSMQWKSDTSLRGQPLNSLTQAIEQGTLKPGDAVYMNVTPGDNDQSNYTSNSGKDSKPHWVTYLGGGQFGDNWSPSMSLDEMIQKYQPRVIDAIYYPHGSSGAVIASK